METLVPIQVEPPNHQNVYCSFYLEKVFSPEECKHLIDITEEKGYEPALLNVGGGRQVLDTSVRSSYRCIIDSEEMADQIWQKIKDFVPQEINGHRLVGLNERLRFLRYDVGQHFNPHFDGVYVRETGERAGERSFLTLLYYLNEDYEGFTCFINPTDRTEQDIVEIVPHTGMILIHQHNIYHSAAPLTRGRKYVMRTDVMYAPQE